MKGPDVGRPCPEMVTLNQAFCAEVKRKQRRSDGTFSLEGSRFEVPSHYRHFEVLHVRYARWDLSTALLVDPHTGTCLTTLYPQDKSENASGMRRALDKLQDESVMPSKEPAGIAPLLKDLMAEYAATGLPPAYLPKGEKS